MTFIYRQGKLQSKIWGKHHSEKARMENVSWQISFVNMDMISIGAVLYHLGQFRTLWDYRIYILR